MVTSAVPPHEAPEIPAAPRKPRKTLVRRLSLDRSQQTRRAVQFAFLLLNAFLGVQFLLWVRYYESHGATMYVDRPAGVDGWLPIAGLINLRYFLATRHIPDIHPSALVLFGVFLAASMLLKKAFCSWLCPVGTLSEMAHKVGQRLFGRNFRIWLWLDLLLRGIKYLLLLLFVVFILLGMSADAVVTFLDAPYWAVSDVKMLRFFTHMSGTTMVVLVSLTSLSLFYKMFWCRYLCPYGALLGLASMISPFKIRRDASGCTGCRRCTAACPSGLEVHTCTAVSSPECTGCLTCTAHCPEKNVLAMQPLFWTRPLSIWVFPSVVILIFVAGITAGMVSGHWKSSLSYADYQRLIPLVGNLTH